MNMIFLLARIVNTWTFFLAAVILIVLAVISGDHHAGMMKDWVGCTTVMPPANE
jgi:hypothetical protein